MRMSKRQYVPWFYLADALRRLPEPITFHAGA
jgi:hypothetical protein